MIFTNDDLIISASRFVDNYEDLQSYAQFLSGFYDTELLNGLSDRQTVFAASNSVVDIGYGENSLVYLDGDSKLNASKGSDVVGLFGDLSFGSVDVSLDQGAHALLLINVDQGDNSTPLINLSGEGSVGIILAGLDEGLDQASVSNGIVYIGEQTTGVHISGTPDITIYDTAFNALAIDLESSVASQDGGGEDVDLIDESIVWTDGDILIYEIYQNPEGINFDASSLDINLSGGDVLESAIVAVDSADHQLQATAESSTAALTSTDLNVAFEELGSASIYESLDPSVFDFI